MMVRALAAVLLGVGLAGCTTTTLAPPVAVAREARAPVTILVSIDGMRADYIDRGITPRLSALAAAGVRGSIRPSFPTKTFPNHWTLVTGKRPDRNGIVDNNFEDPRRPGVTFTMAAKADPFWWDEAEPVWVTAERAGVRTATMFWPGSNVALGNARPADWQAFDQAVTGAQRVDAVVDWMRRPAATRPRLVTLYFDTVDTAGHRAGPDAPETNAAIADVDSQIGRLVDALAALNQPANLVITTDHGMAQTSPDRMIQISTMADPRDYRVVTDGPYAGLEPQPGREAALAARLLAPHPHATCWRKQDIPARFHYGRNARVPSFYCLAETGWLLLREPPRDPRVGGTHGYDNMAPEMRGMLVASGPAFTRGATLPQVDNVDVAPLIARLLGVQPAAGIDGSAASFEPVLNR